MTQELVAYLIQADGEVRTLPTEGLHLALQHVVQANLAEKLGVSSGNGAVYEFLHMLKREMRAAISSPPATE